METVTCSFDVMYNFLKSIDFQSKVSCWRSDGSGSNDFDERVFTALVFCICRGVNHNYIKELHDHKGTLNVELNWLNIKDSKSLIFILTTIMQAWEFVGEVDENVRFLNIDQ